MDATAAQPSTTAEDQTFTLIWMFDARILKNDDVVEESEYCEYSCLRHE